MRVMLVLGYVTWSFCHTLCIIDSLLWLITGVKSELHYMGRRSGVSINERNIALGFLKGASRAYDVARRFGCNERTSYRLQQRILHTGSINDLP